MPGISQRCQGSRIQRATVQKGQNTGLGFHTSVFLLLKLSELGTKDRAVKDQCQVGYILNFPPTLRKSTTLLRAGEGCGLLPHSARVCVCVCVCVCGAGGMGSVTAEAEWLPQKRREGNEASWDKASFNRPPSQSVRLQASRPPGFGC